MYRGHGWVEKENIASVVLAKTARRIFQFFCLSEVGRSNTCSNLGYVQSRGVV
jgi:hypothetical protein